MKIRIIFLLKYLIILQQGGLSSHQNFLDGRNLTVMRNGIQVQQKSCQKRRSIIQKYDKIAGDVYQANRSLAEKYDWSIQAEKILEYINETP